MDVQNLLDNIQEFTDLELAVFLCLVAHGHCLMSIEESLVNDLASELALIVSDRFGLSYAVLDPEDFPTAEHFGEASLEEEGASFSVNDDKNDSTAEPGSLRTRLTDLDIRAAPRPSHGESQLDNRMIKNVIIAKHFNLADEHVQVQAIEIINNKRFISRTTVHTTPKTFLFIPIVSTSSEHIRLIPHLNDRIFISHHHDPEDGFINLEEMEDSSESSSGPSHDNHNLQQQNPQHISWTPQKRTRHITRDSIDKIRTMGESTAMTPEIRRYLQDIVTFLRIERGVDGAITPRATTHFVALAKYLAPLHGINFVTPSLIALAARKVYTHRINIATAMRERSMQYGSDPVGVAQLIEGLTPQEVIETVLNTVQCPL